MLDHKTAIITRDRLLYVEEEAKNIVSQWDTNLIKCTEIVYGRTYKSEKRIIYLNKSFINEIRER